MTLDNAGQWSFEWLRGHHSVFGPEVLARWRQWFDAAPETNVFQHPDLIRIWLETRGAAMRLKPEFCVATHADGTRIVLPLVRRPRAYRNLWLSRLEAVGEPNFDYQDPLIVSNVERPTNWAAFWTAFFHELSTRRAVDSCWFRRLNTHAAPPGAWPDAGNVSPFIRLEGHADWPSFAARLSGNFRTGINRQRNKLNREAPLSLTVLAPGQQPEASNELEQLMEHHARRWRGSPTEHYFAEPGMRSFYLRLLADLLPTGLLHFSVLRSGQRSIAWHVGFFWRKALHWYKPVYDVDYQALGAGKLLLAELVARGIAEGWDLIDLGVGDEEYKNSWTSEKRPLVQYEWRAVSIRSKIRGLVSRLRGTA